MVKICSHIEVNSIKCEECSKEIQVCSMDKIRARVLSEKIYEKIEYAIEVRISSSFLGPAELQSEIQEILEQ